MQINPREKKIIGFAVFAVIGILIWNANTPSVGAKGTTGQVPLPKAISDSNLNKHNEQRLTREVSELDPKVNELAYNLPPDELVPRTIRNLQQIAAKSGVHIREVKPIRPRVLASGMGTSVPLEVHFLAPFQPNAMRFLYYVEDPAGKMVLDKLDITTADPRMKTVEVSAQVTVYTKIIVGPNGSDATTGARPNAATGTGTGTGVKTNATNIN